MTKGKVGVEKMARCMSQMKSEEDMKKWLQRGEPEFFLNIREIFFLRNSTEDKRRKWCERNKMIIGILKTNLAVFRTNLKYLDTIAYQYRIRG